ncbi:MAG TPA: hypothetical protein ENJ93_02540 [Chloroflexi bacterium]|nr:hypothetical protein [Chloroflexota bacterium]
MNEQEKETMKLLTVLEPTAADAPTPAPQALAQVNAALREENRMSWSYRLKQTVFAPQRRWATAVSLAAVLLVVAFTFPGFRAAANDFLSLFRVQKFAPLSISPDQLALLEKIADEGLMPGELIIHDEPGALTPADNLVEAAALTGLPAVRTIPALGEPGSIYTADGGGGTLIIDLAGSRSILEAVGADPLLLPDELDGARVNVTVFSGVEQRWGDDLTLAQSLSPLVDYPDGLDEQALGQALLQLLGLAPDEAQRLAQEIDWASTLLLPIPQNVAAFQEVTIGGSSGIALQSLDGSDNAILWQNDGLIFLLTGSQSVDELATLANGME